MSSSIKINALGQIEAAKALSALLIFSLSIFLPYFIHLQWLTGPIVNALLILCLVLVGVRSALILCLVPSLVALGSGLIPSVLAPMVPFVMVSNAILVVAMDYFLSRSQAGSAYWKGLATGAGLKFLFLFLNISLVSGLLIKQELAAKVAQMLSWPQLFTALTGGMMAFVLLKFLKKI